MSKAKPAAPAQPLQDTQVKNAKATDKAYRLRDGGSLYLLVRPSGVKSWEFRYKKDGKAQAAILGTYPDLKLAAAREARDALRVRVRHQLKNAPVPGMVPTVREAAEDWIKRNRGDWSEKHAAQIEQNFRDHVYEHMGKLPVDKVQPEHVLKVIDALLDGDKQKPRVETARRTRQRLDALFEEVVLRYGINVSPVKPTHRAITRRLKSALRAAPAKHFPCISTDQQPALATAMLAYQGTQVVRTLMWLVALTAVRTGEARYATWDEFDLKAGVWTIPAERMKAGAEHRVPLVPAVVEMLRAMPTKRDWVFTHPLRSDKPASENALLYVMAELGYKGRMTGHGFRSLFSTMANESGLHRADVIEAALAHTEGNAVRGAYNRATYWTERLKLAEWWASKWLDTKTAKRKRD